jgi:3-oxoacyl-[acyl-carrier protein] reductase
MLLDDRVALITGSGSGQGRAAALLFAEQGARVAVIDIDDAGASETVRTVEEKGGEAIALHADVATRTGCDEMIAATFDRWGRLDVLYNNAAVQMSGRLVECTGEDWDLTIATNLTAIFRACRAAIPLMLEGGYGSIVNTASTLGLIGSEGYAAYGAAKAGLVALTKQIAAEYGPVVRANVIAPGSIDTPRFRKVLDKTPNADQFLDMLMRNMPLKRLGTADDIARTALFLASPESAYTSGAVIPVDGGLAAMR